MEAAITTRWKRTAPSSFRLDSAPSILLWKNGQVTRKTVTNQPISGILIHKVDPDGEGIPGVVFLLYDSNRKPICQYTSDDRGYVYIDDFVQFWPILSA